MSEPFGPGVDLETLATEVLFRRLGELTLDYHLALQWHRQNEELLAQQAAPGKADALYTVVCQAKAEVARLFGVIAPIVSVLEERRKHGIA